MAIETRQHACSIATGDGESDVLEQPSARTSLTSHLRKAPAGEERSLKQNANSQPVLFTSYTEGRNRRENNAIFFLLDDIINNESDVAAPSSQ
eukprot:XP_014784168.1 PREDICTED: uncharacterized protein LOC106879209 isoform X2 [Octopus bimaculoides]